MADLGSGIDLLVIPEPQASASHPAVVAATCSAFAGLPIPNPCVIAIQTDGSTRAAAAAEELRTALDRIVRPVARRVDVPAHWTSPASLLHMPPTWKKLLLLISGGRRSFPDTSMAKLLLTAPSAQVQPVLPRVKNVLKIVGPDLAHLNVKFWDGSIASVVADVLALAGLTTLDRRVFISYRRTDARPLADQLFDALSRANFDVFLDRFSVDPGVDFQRRLTEELAFKSMVLLLETEHIMESQWTLYEINFARKHRLGLFALQLPRGTAVPALGPDERKVLTPDDFSSLKRPGRLRKPVLQQVVQEVETVHGAALIRRRQYLRDAMSAALLKFGAMNQSFGRDGLLSVQTGQGNYILQLSTRPPELGDFSLTGGNLAVGTGGFVIAPADTLSAATTTSLNWLSGVCRIPYFDEGRILDVARSICGPPAAARPRAADRRSRKR
jgi:hypothetical protein